MARRGSPTPNQQKLKDDRMDVLIMSKQHCGPLQHHVGKATFQVERWLQVAGGALTAPGAAHCSHSPWGASELGT